MAISCKLNQNLLRNTQCGYSLPEINEIYLVDYDDISGWTLDEGTTASAGCVAISGIGFNASAEAYKIVPMKNSASFTDELVVNDNGAKYRTATLNFTVSGNFTSCMHAALDQLSLGRYIAFLTLADGSTVCLGRTNPLEATQGTFSGGGTDSTNGIAVVLTGNLAESTMPLNDDAVAALKAKVHA